MSHEERSGTWFIARALRLVQCWPFDLLGLMGCGFGIVNLTCFEGILAFAITIALLQAIEFTEVRFLD